MIKIILSICILLQSVIVMGQFAPYEFNYAIHMKGIVNVNEQCTDNIYASLEVYSKNEKLLHIQTNFKGEFELACCKNNLLSDTLTIKVYCVGAKIQTYNYSIDENFLYLLCEKDSVNGLTFDDYIKNKNKEFNDDIIVIPEVIKEESSIKYYQHRCTKEIITEELYEKLPNKFIFWELMY